MGDVQANTVRALLVVVGGATSPAIHALNEQRPPFICFFVSADSKPMIRSAILPALKYDPEHYDWIETPAPQSLLECFRALDQQLPLMLEKWGVAPEALGVEYTSGTKPMSVAAVLATVESSSQYSYVGAADPSGRDRGGIGVVLDGKEFTWFQTNPWEELAVRARREIALLFNHGRFADAQERAARLAKVAPAGMAPVYRALADLIEGYALWDRFEYKQAQIMISKALAPLQMYVAGREEPLRVTLDVVAAQIGFLRGLLVDSVEAKRLDLLDMLANATRRAEIAQKYDDAVARLYSALEAAARYRLLYTYRIKTGAVEAQQVPEKVRTDYVRRYGNVDQPGEPLKLGLEASYHLLADIGDDLGRKYLLTEVELNKVLLARNQSRLAHGTVPVRSDIYTKLRQIVMSFADVTEAELPRFPELRL